MVNIQNAPAAPAPGVGLAGLSELLGKSGAFKDITGLDANQQNAIKTYLSNQENVRALAEMAKGMAGQAHNTQYSDKIVDSLRQARDDGAISDEEYKKLVRNHLQQQIDGGDSVRSEASEARAAKPTLADAAVSAVQEGRQVSAKTTSPDGSSASIKVAERDNKLVLARVSGVIPLIKQPTSQVCWAAVASMMVSWKRRKEIPIAEVVALGGQFFSDKLANNQSLLADEKSDLIRRLGMQTEASASLQPEHLIQLIQRYGPLWVTIDTDPSSSVLPHSKILVKVVSDDGTTEPSKVSLEFIDPIFGQRETEPYTQFVSDFEQVKSQAPVENYLQVIRFVDEVGQQTQGEGSALIEKVVHLDVYERLAHHAGAASGTLRRALVGYVYKKINECWSSGGLLGITIQGDSAHLVSHLKAMEISSVFAELSDTERAHRTAVIKEALQKIQNGAEAGADAVTKQFSHGGKYYSLVILQKLTASEDKDRYITRLVHECAHVFTQSLRSGWVADRDSSLFVKSISTDELKSSAGNSRATFYTELLGQRLNWLMHEEIVGDFAWNKTVTNQTLAKGCYLTATKDPQLASSVLSQLPDDATRREQVGIWLEKFIPSKILNDDDWTTKLHNSFSAAGALLKKWTQAEYDAETNRGGIQ